MTPSQLAEALAASGPMSATDLARRTRTPLQTLYGLLVAAEGRGLVRINVDSADQSHRTWEAMAEHEYA